MAARLPDGLRRRVIARLLQAEAYGASVRLYFPDVWDGVQRVAAPKDYLDLLLSSAELAQAMGAASGPLASLGTQLESRGWTESAEIRAFLAAPPEAAANPVDPFAQTRVGWRGSLLLDHESFRGHLRDMCTGDRRGVWLPAPLGPSSRACIELITAIGDAYRTRVATCEWQPGTGLTLKQMVDTLLLYLEPSAYDSSVSHTTTAAHVNGLANDLLRAAAKTPSDVILVFQNFRTNESPPECMQLIEALIDRVCHGTFARRVRLALLGCELTTPLLKKTVHGPVGASQLRREAHEQLTKSGLSGADADTLLDDFWQTPPDLDIVHARVSEILEANGG